MKRSLLPALAPVFAPALAVAVALFAPPPAAAGAFSDLVMAPGLFAAAPDGPVMAYAHSRAAAPPLTDLAESRLEVSAGPGERGRVLSIDRAEAGKDLPAMQFPASGPNPVLLYFLESAARSMAEATGGSPFYIRNRMREALGAAGLAEAGPAGGEETVVLRPFEGDPNRGRMGDFADLALSLRFDPAEPGRLLELSADTAPGTGGYHDRLTLIAED